MQNAPGKTMIFVPGVLFIVSSAAGILLGLMAIAGGALLGSAGLGGSSAQAGAAAAVGIIALVVGVVLILSSAINLVIGIIAVRNANKPEKAKTVITCGYVMIALSALSFIVALITAVVSNDFSSVGTSVVSLAFGLILPIIMILGGKKNQQFAESNRTL